MGEYADAEIARQQKEMFGIDPGFIPKQKRKQAAVEALSKLPSIRFHSNNNFVHIMIEGPVGGQRIDYWPSSDMWKVAPAKAKHYSLPLLLQHIATWLP